MTPGKQWTIAKPTEEIGNILLHLESPAKAADHQNLEKPSHKLMTSGKDATMSTFIKMRVISSKTNTFSQVSVVIMQMKGAGNALSTSTSPASLKTCIASLTQTEKAC